MMMEIPAGTVILREGEVNMDMYKIIRGNVELYTGYRTKREAILGILSKDSYFGELGLLAQKPAIYTVVAYNDVLVLRINESDIDDYIRNNHHDAVNLMKKMASSMYSMKYSMDMFVEDMAEGRIDLREKQYRGYFSKQFAYYNANYPPTRSKFERKA